MLSILLLYNKNILLKDKLKLQNIVQNKVLSLLVLLLLSLTRLNSTGEIDDFHFLAMITFT